jgi:predicted RND superfamily exporter protein
LLFGAILAVLSAFPISNLRWDLQLQDTLSFSDEANNDYKKIESDFGGLGSLTVVLHSDDSLLNYTTAKALAQMLHRDSLVHFVDFETDVDFYTRHCLLYVDESDLDSVINRLRPMREKFISKNNPLYVDLDAGPNSTADIDTAFHIDDLTEKYKRLMAGSHSNASGTIRVVDIYPTHPLSDLKASRELLSQTSTYLSAIIQGGNVQAYFTGKVFETIRRGRTMLPEAKLAGALTALFILILFIVNFYRQPQLIFISSVATALPIIYTLALATLIYGRINLFTLLLAIVLPGQACQIVSHVYRRYFEERARNLSPQLCIESAILGIGPSTCTSSCIMASLFACMMFVPLPGIRELAMLGCIGTLMNWFVTILIATALLRVFQRNRPFAVNKFGISQTHTVTLLPRKLNVILIAVVSVASIVCLIYGGKNLKFFYDFDKTEIQKQPSAADSLIAQTGFPEYDPIIIQVPDEASGKELYRNFTKLKERGGIPNIKKMYTLAQFSPHMSESRAAKLDSMQAMLTPNVISQLDSGQLRTFTLIRESLYRRNLDAHDQPKNILSKFSDKSAGADVYRITRAYHGHDDDGPTPISDLTLEVMKP